MQLEEVLSHNPFTEAVVARWKQDLDEFNKGNKQRSELNFVLNGDRDWASAIDREEPVYKDLLPVPFLGSPTAPVWLILMNPSYSPIDLYDNLGLCPGCEKTMICPQKCHESTCRESDTDWIDHKLDPLHALNERQTILLRQLRLGQNSSFAFLEKAFDVLGDSASHRGKGGYRWWSGHLFGKEGRLLQSCAGDAQTAGGKLFVLETFPYHSEHFHDGFYSCDYLSSSIYWDFWKALIQWGCENGRKLILRPDGNNFSRIISESGGLLNSTNSVHLKNVRRVWLTFGNLRGETNVIASIKRALGGAKL